MITCASQQGNSVFGFQKFVLFVRMYILALLQFLEASIYKFIGYLPVQRREVLKVLCSNNKQRKGGYQLESGGT